MNGKIPAHGHHFFSEYYLCTYEEEHDLNKKKISCLDCTTKSKTKEKLFVTYMGAAHLVLEVTLFFANIIEVCSRGVHPWHLKSSIKQGFMAQFHISYVWGSNRLHRNRTHLAKHKKKDSYLTSSYPGYPNFSPPLFSSIRFSEVLRYYKHSIGCNMLR
jgi:hypothetical protein